MSIASEIQRLQTIKTNIRSALVDKGVSASTHNMANFAEDILSIQTDVPDLNGAIIQVSSDVGATIVAQKGGTSFTAVVTETGIVEFTVRNSGIWIITASKIGAETITNTVNVFEDGATYSVSMRWRTILYTVGDKPSNIGYYEFKPAGTIPSAENQWLSDGAILQCGITSTGNRALNYLQNISPIPLGNTVSLNIVGGSKSDAEDSYWLVASNEPISLALTSNFPYFGVANTTKAVTYRRFTQLTYGSFTLDTSSLKGMMGYVAVMVGSYNRTEAIKFRDWIVE